MDYITTSSDDGRKLRDVLRGPMAMSYTAMKQAKWNGSITVDGVPCTVDRIVHTGQLIRVSMPDILPAYHPIPWQHDIPVLFEDDDLMIVDKPAPMASQSSARQSDYTLQNALCAMSGDQEHFVYRPVNRLDKGTSGLMVVAKSAHSQQLMQKMLHTDLFVRSYLAIVCGAPKEPCGVIDLPIAKADGSTVKRIISDAGKPSCTHYQVLQRGERSLVALTLHTGRTHQIRVHMSAIGCPVFGDFLYGEESPLLPGRFALHSHTISLQHPISHEQLQITSPLPEELSRLL